MCYVQSYLFIALRFCFLHLFFFFTLAITVVSQLGAIVVDVVLLLVFLRTAIWNVTQDPIPVAV